MISSPGSHISGFLKFRQAEAQTEGVYQREGAYPKFQMGAESEGFEDIPGPPQS